jgi:hypothetical protein
MERVPVRSKDIAIVGYDPAASLLEVTFRGGGVYRYTKVPPEIHQAFLQAESHGTYFNQNIKDQFACTKVS